MSLVCDQVEWLALGAVGSISLEPSTSMLFGCFRIRKTCNQNLLAARCDDRKLAIDWMLVSDNSHVLDEFDAFGCVTKLLASQHAAGRGSQLPVSGSPIPYSTVWKWISASQKPLGLWTRMPRQVSQPVLEFESREQSGLVPNMANTDGPIDVVRTFSGEVKAGGDVERRGQAAKGEEQRAEGTEQQGVVAGQLDLVG